MGSRGQLMADTQRIIEAALAMLAMLAVVGLVVGMTLRHHIGGFIRTVEREAREQAEAEEALPAEQDNQASDPERAGNADEHRSEL